MSEVKSNLNTIIYTIEKKPQKNNTQRRKIKKYTSFEELLENIDTEINRMIYDIGLDQFLLSKNSFKAGDYNKIIFEYDELYNNEQEKSEKVVNQAFEYIETKLKDTHIYIQNYTKNEETTLYELLLMLHSEENDYVDYKYIGKFLNYISSKHTIIEKKLK